MSNRDLLLDFLEDTSPKGHCDDCLSSRLGITPRQQVNIICRGLSTAGVISREKAPCAACSRSKILNSLVPSPGGEPAHRVREPTSTYDTSAPSDVVDVEKLRTQVVRICWDLWDRNEPRRTQLGISKLINTLRDKELLPRHQANMMLTLCGIRNLHVYERLEMGEREIAIADAAWGIIRDWWESLPKD